MPRRKVTSAASQLGRLGGKARSAAKAEAARLNGAKGGRPKKVVPDLEPEPDVTPPVTE